MTATRRHRTAASRYPQSAQQMPISTCPDCGKQAYTSRAAAKSAAKRIYPGSQMRVYRCRDARWWHITSQSTVVITRMRDWYRS